MVFATAFGTALFGIFIDNGFTIEKIALVSATYILASICLTIFYKKTLNPVNIVKIP